MDILLAYLAGLLTLINPCVLPVLPIILASAVQADRRGPLMMALGLSISFVSVGMLVAVFGRSLGISDTMIAKAGAVMMILFGVVLLVPRLSALFSTLTARLSTRADSGMDAVDRSGLRGQFFGGLLLGFVWVPCVGPTLGGAIALASAGESLIWAAVIMISFALGISTIIIALGYGAGSAIRTRRDWLRSVATKARPIMAIIFILTGLAIWFDLQQVAEIWLLDHLPFWLQDLSVRF